MEWVRANPVFPVADVAVAIEWYRRVFAFEARLVNPPGDPVPVYAVLSHDGVSLHLLRRDEAPHGLTAPVQAQFWVGSGLDDLFRHAESMGVEVLQRPDDRPWGHRDFMVADPDGNVVWVTVRRGTMAVGAATPVQPRGGGVAGAVRRDGVAVVAGNWHL